MSAASQPESKAPSRRALLAGVLGGLGAMAASAIGRVSSVRAADGDPVLIATGNTGTDTTSITTTGNSAFTGLCSNVTGAGVVGHSTAATGATLGVWGLNFSTSGTGVQGQATAASGTTYGVQGVSSSPAGTGIHALNAGGGLAFKATGRVKFSTSGVATIKPHTASTTVTPGVNVASTSFVLLTPRTNMGGASLWFTIDAANDRFTIHTNVSRNSGVKVAWLLLG